MSGRTRLFRSLVLCIVLATQTLAFASAQTTILPGPADASPATSFSRFADWESARSHCLFKTFDYSSHRICSDFRRFYSCDNALNFGVALAGGAVLANTSMDRNFSNWYQKDVRSSGTDDFARTWKTFGEWELWVPIIAVSAIGYRIVQQSDRNPSGKRCFLGEFASRTARGYLVGEPSLLLFQSLTGAGRPSDGSPRGSYWRPFKNDHGVSGHAFIGAMPFITAAQMVEPPLLKGVFYTLSTFPAWSRVNDNMHYLSQAVLGWYLAYLSCRAVSQTEGTVLPKGLTVFPVAESGGVGLGVLYRR